MNKSNCTIYPFAEDNGNFLVIDNNTMEIINDSTIHLKYLLDATSTSS